MGAWQRLSLKQGEMVVAHIMVSEDVGKRAAAFSGTRALFSTVLPGTKASKGQSHFGASTTPGYTRKLFPICQFSGF